MKVLSIGNSFSQDAQRWLHQCAASAGVDLTCVNLCIGGCSLARHWQNVQSGEAAYTYEVNGCYEGEAALVDTLRAEAWDIVTVQQVSGESGRPQSFWPELPQLAEVIRRECPSATVYIHQTWGYEYGADHPSLSEYDYDSDEMFRRVRDSYVLAAKLVDAPLIPAGEVVYRVRLLPTFDVRNGGMSLHRDGYHLSLVYGRYAAAVTWLATLCGVDPEAVTFVPAEEDVTADEAILQQIQHVVKGVVSPQ
ncbi:MAG: DUF4886 domain-containing protein [Ruminococcaceae bacterium]|nr:DUF4886 domain-containing protein [Oscillospiraceae bacterium]